MYRMRNTSLTVRTDPGLRAALDRRAEQEEKTVSRVVREILEAALEERSIAERAGHLEGRLRLGSADGAWRDRLRERNWRA